ncbi:hypothetical protein NDU88_004772 [Pleurodeles waltl]|uniref:Uncharacterized protein n=1 Tax=Pleurodeles waltl TaxID=8319 RepID=A0AAV7T8F0_PLEWA|nr:hypothetical protein NDU88_004772 [Pleurodeles waltl]
MLKGRVSKDSRFLPVRSLSELLLERREPSFHSHARHGPLTEEEAWERRRSLERRSSPLKAYMVRNAMGSIVCLRTVGLAHD